VLKILLGNMFESKAQTLVNTINCVGVMGKGIALEFKNRFPAMYNDYVKRCAEEQVKLGQPYLFRQATEPWILNFPTKDHWRSVSRLDDIVRGLEFLERRYQEWGITSLAVPPLGTGQGQLEWRVVGPTLYRHLSRLAIPVELFAPYDTPHQELQPEFFEHAAQQESGGAPPSRIDPAWIAIVEILFRIEQEPYHWPVGRVLFQKIAYFATECGIPTGLQYSKASFGPYSPGVRPQLTRLANNGVTREQRLGRMFAVRVGPTFEDARVAFQDRLHEWEPVIDRIADLFLRMRTQQAEVAATVHYASNLLSKATGEKPTEIDVLNEVMRWKSRRRPPLDEHEVALAIRNLSVLGWLDVKASADLPLSEEALLGA
jgi:uncharacterized protein YwgA/O-acetyl-ADP-ribose deacetylase (regulator of RNase III)